MRYVTFLKYKVRLPWWSSGWESACQCRGHRFNSCQGRFHMLQGNWVLKPQLWKLLHPRPHAFQQEKPLQWEAWRQQIESIPHPQQLKKAHAQQQKCSAAKNKRLKKINKVFESSRYLALIAHLTQQISATGVWLWPQFMVQIEKRNM